MKCKICGAPSGKYPLCRGCNIKRERGEVLKCATCNQWHYVNAPCPVVGANTGGLYLYDAKSALISKSEQVFYHAILVSLPEGFYVFPQINLASFIERTDDARFHNELFRNVDFLITDKTYCPKMVIEINDQTHYSYDRKERDEKVQRICEEAGIPILKLWTQYGVNQAYIQGKINEILGMLPVQRVHHYSQPEAPVPSPLRAGEMVQKKKKAGCYVATCVYGSYDCPPVWVLRRYRDNVLLKSWLGKCFVWVYYAVSPLLVRAFGDKKWFVVFWRRILDVKVKHLQKRGMDDTAYYDV